MGCCERIGGGYRGCLEVELSSFDMRGEKRREGRPGHGDGYSYRTPAPLASSCSSVVIPCRLFSNSLFIVWSLPRHDVCANG